MVSIKIEVDVVDVDAFAQKDCICNYDPWYCFYYNVHTASTVYIIRHVTIGTFIHTVASVQNSTQTEIPAEEFDIFARTARHFFPVPGGPSGEIYRKLGFRPEDCRNYAGTNN